LFEGTIVTHAISYYFKFQFNTIEGTLIFAILGFVKLLFVWYGMKALQIFQTWGVILYALLLGFGLFQLTNNYQIAGPEQWILPGLPEHAMWTAFMMANGQMVFQGLMAADYGRFAKENAGYRGGFITMIGMLVPMFVTILIGPLFAFTLMPAIEGVQSDILAADAGYVFPTIMGIWGVLFVVVTQFRVNVMNLYSGSLAFSNTFSMAFRFTPGRQFWMVAVYVSGCVFYIFNILQYLEKWLAVTGILTNTWIFIMFADHFVCRKLLRLGPTDFIEYRRPFLYRWNPTGLISLCVGVSIGIAGLLGVYPIYYASFLAMLAGAIVHIVFTVVTRGHYYFTEFPQDRETSWTPPSFYRGVAPEKENTESVGG
jgi:cytosine permease